MENPSHWSGVHLGLIFAIHAQLNRVLPKALVAEMDEYVWVTEGSDEDRAILGRPDVFVPSSDTVRTATRTSKRPSAQLVLALQRNRSFWYPSLPREGIQ